MKNVLVRNSTAEFLTFIAEGKEEGIQVLYKNAKYMGDSESNVDAI